jgi:hypothetical protein
MHSTSVYLCIPLILNLLSRAEFVTTDNELEDIAASAVTRFSRPKAASGIPRKASGELLPVGMFLEYLDLER